MSVSKLRSRFEESFSESLYDKYLDNRTEKVFRSNVTSSSPDVQGLFLSFNRRFFWSRLNDVEVFWSNRMTSCAGICYYNRKVKHCYIRLSSPLLKLRPHSDLVDTILHEMIHAYLFVTNNISDRSGHGPNFHKHKDRINKEAGTNITVYHSFTSEVRLYQQHWWRCNGSCQYESPHFGMVKRSMNRPPGPNDFWWNRHKSRCSGTYTKIREPVEYTLKKTKGNGMKGQGSEREYGLEKRIDGIDWTHHLVPGASASTGDKTKKGSTSSVTFDLGDESKAKKLKTGPEVCTCPVCYEIVSRLSMGEHLESCNGIQNIFDFDFDLIEDIDDSDNDISEDVELKKTGENCPICSSFFEGDLKSHVNNCLKNSGIVNILDDSTDLNEDKSSETNTMSDVKKFQHCVLCGLDVIGSLDGHVLNCFGKSVNNHDFDIIDCELPQKSCNMETTVLNSVLDDSFCSKSENVSNNNVCPVCNKRFDINIEAHMNDCVNNSMSSSDFDESIGMESVIPKTIDDCLTQVHKGSKRNYVSGSQKSDGNSNLIPISKKNNEKGLEDFNSICLKYLTRSDDSIDVCDSGTLKINDNRNLIPLSNKNSEKGLEDFNSLCLKYLHRSDDSIEGCDSVLHEKMCDNQIKVPKTGFENNSSFLDLTDCRKSCPVCSKFIEGDMSFHLDSCLNKSCSVDDFNDPIIVISDSESPVKVVNSSKIPLPKKLDINNIESERRIACRICGMKFGVSKFNGHVCYEC